MSDRERQLWTEFVRKREQRKDGKRARKPRARKGETPPAAMEAELDDLVKEAEANGIGRATRQGKVAPASAAQK